MSADGGSDVLAERIAGLKALIDADIHAVREKLAEQKTEAGKLDARIGAQERFRIWFLALTIALALLIVASDDASAIIKAAAKVFS